MEVNGNQLGSDKINKSVFFDDSSHRVRRLWMIADLGAICAAR
jgi:hypothetical protein